MKHDLTDPAGLIALAAELRLWVLSLLARLVEACGAPFALDAWVRGEVLRVERQAKMIAVILAWAQLRHTTSAPPCERAHTHPHADARRALRSPGRQMMRGLLGTAGFRAANGRSRLMARIERLQRFLARIDCAARRVTQRAVRGWSVLGFGVARVRADALPATPEAHASAHDTS